MNCWEDYSRFKTLYRLLNNINQTIDIHRQSPPKDELLERLHNHDGPLYTVIFDEVDQIEDKSLFYGLCCIRNLTMILIANNEEGLFAHIDERLNSCLTNFTHIHFRPYTSDELTAILYDRVCWALAGIPLTTPQLESIADAAAGDARIVLGILRRSAQHA